MLICWMERFFLFFHRLNRKLFHCIYLFSSTSINWEFTLYAYIVIARVCIGRMAFFYDLMDVDVHWPGYWRGFLLGHFFFSR